MIDTAYHLCLRGEKIDKDLAAALKTISPVEVHAYYQAHIKNKDEDTKIFFNWFLGERLNMSINEL